MTQSTPGSNTSSTQTVISDNEAVTQSYNDLSNSIEKSSNNLKKISDLYDSSQITMKNFSKNTNEITNKFNGLNDMLNTVGVSMKSTNALTGQQVTQFSLLSNALIGVKSSYSNFSNIDTTGLNTFSSQAAALFDIIKSSPGTQAASQATQAVGNAAKAAGADMNEFNEFARKGADVFSQYAMKIFESADNQLRLKNAFIQMSAQTGNLNNLMTMAGSNFENINAVIGKQSEMMSRAMRATSATSDEVANYYSELGRVPGALSALVNVNGEAEESTEMLTASIKLARGQGRDYKDVISDMQIAFKDYGLVGEGALKFSARMGEVTQNLGVEMSTVKSALSATADSFKMFTGVGGDASRMAEGLASIMNEYGQSLRNTGLSGTAAVSVIQNMTNNLSNMSIAQKALLSSQSGGPGGLMGAFQMDKLIATDPAKAMEKQMQLLKKQMGGNLVGMDEASTSQAGAAQMAKQIQILRQGPMGQFAKTDQEAEAIANMMKQRDSGKISSKELSDNILKTSIDKGTALQEQSTTSMNTIMNDVSAIRMAAESGSLNFMQSQTAGDGSGGKLNDQLTRSQKENKANLKDNMTRASSMGKSGDDLKNSYAIASGTGSSAEDSSGKFARNSINEAYKFKDQAGPAVNSLIDGLKGAIESKNKQGVYDQSLKLKQDIDLKRQEAKMNQDLIKKSSMSLKDKNEKMNLINKDINSANDEENIVRDVGNKFGFDFFNDKNKTSGSQLGNVANLAASRKSSQSSDQTNNYHSNNEKSATNNQNINVQVTGYCLKCKQQIEGIAQPTSINPASTNT